MFVNYFSRSAKYTSGRLLVRHRPAPPPVRRSRERISPPYTSQIHARSVAHTPFRTVSLGSRVNSPCAALRAPDYLARSRSHFGSGLFNEVSHGCRLRHVDRMAARNLLNGRSRSLRHRALGGRGDHPVFSCDEVPAWLAPPCRLADRAAQGFNTPRDLRVGHERSLIGTQVGGE